LARRHLVNEGAFALGLGTQQRVAGSRAAQRLIDQPGEWFNAGATKVFLEPGSFMNRRRLRQSDDDNSCEGRIAKPRQESSHGIRHTDGIPLDLPLIGLRGIEQKEGMSGRRRVADNEALFAFLNLFGEGAKHSDFLGTRGSEIFLQQRSPGRIKVGAGNAHHFFGIPGDFK
jgi:hypothetical protein